MNFGGGWTCRSAVVNSPAFRCSRDRAPPEPAREIESVVSKEATAWNYPRVSHDISWCQLVLGVVRGIKFIVPGSHPKLINCLGGGVKRRIFLVSAGTLNFVPLCLVGGLKHRPIVPGRGPEIPSHSFCALHIQLLPAMRAAGPSSF